MTGRRTDRDIVYSALHDAIGFQRGLLDAYQHMTDDPAYGEAQAAIAEYWRVLKRRYPDRRPADPFKGTVLVDVLTLIAPKERKT